MGGRWAASEHMGLGSHSPGAHSSCTCQGPCGLGQSAQFFKPRLFLPTGEGVWDCPIPAVGEVLGLRGAVLILSKHKDPIWKVSLGRERSCWGLVLFSGQKCPPALWGRTRSRVRAPTRITERVGQGPRRGRSGHRTVQHRGGAPELGAGIVR